MKFHLFCLCLLVSFSKLWAQQTRIVSKDRESYYEEYQVLESDKKIRHGSYVKLNKLLVGGYAIESIGNYSYGLKNGYWETYYEGKNIKEKGFYKADEKDSLWVMFFSDGVPKKLEKVQTETGSALQVMNANPVVCKTGKYKSGHLVGIWEFFDDRGVLIQSYDYDRDSLIFLKNSDLSNVPAGFIGGEHFLTWYVYDTFDFNGVMETIDTKINLQSGKIVFEFVVDEDGNAGEIIELQNTINNKKLYARALDVTRSFDNKWYPTVSGGRRQATKKRITFDLSVESSYSSSDPNGKFVFARTTKGFTLDISVN